LGNLQKFPELGPGEKEKEGLTYTCLIKKTRYERGIEGGGVGKKSLGKVKMVAKGPKVLLGSTKGP